MSSTTHIKKFAGLDMANEYSDNIALAYEMKNFTVDSCGYLRKRPGFMKVFGSVNDIDGMWAGYLGDQHYFLVACAGNLIGINTNTGATTTYGYIGSGKCCMFEFDKKIYILNDTEYSCFNGVSVGYVEGYVPIVATGCSPDGKGTPFENANMLTSKRRQLFSADGTTAVYHLAEKNIAGVSKVTVGGVATAQFIVNKTAGTVTFNAAYVPAAGINNVEITYSVQTNQRRMIADAKHAMLFGGNVDCRVFLWGNPDYPNYRFYSELANGMPSAEYFPINNYSVVGNSAITDIVSQYDRQLIFTKDMAFYSLCELRQDALGNYYSSFPVYNLNGTKGSLISGAGCVVNNEPITLCPDGLNRWVSTAVENEKNAICFSSPIDNEIWSIVRHAVADYVQLYNFQPNSELYLVHGDTSYIYNYEFKVWYEYSGFTPKMMVTSDGELYFAATGGVYKFDKNLTSDCGNPIHAFWRSPMSNFGEPDKRKDIAFVSVSVNTDNKAKFKIGTYDSRNFVPQYAYADISSYGVYSYTLRGRKKRINCAGICIDSNDSTSDFYICALSVTTHTKGDTSKIGLY